MVNVDEMVDRAKAMYRAGRRAEARDLLLDAVRQDANHQDAWLWLSGMVDSLEDQRACLENVLALNPTHARARKGLEEIERQLAEQGGSHETPPADDPAPEPNWGAPATSVEWARDDGAPVYGSGKQVDLPSREDYDAWLSELHLGVEESSPPQTPPFVNEAPVSPFGDTSYMVEPEPFFGDSPLAPRSDDPDSDDLWASIARNTDEPDPALIPALTPEDYEDHGRVWPAPRAPAEPAFAPAPQAVRHEFSFDDDVDEVAPPPQAAEPALRAPVAEPVEAPARAPDPAPEPPRAAQNAAPSGAEGYFAYIPAEITAQPVRRRSRTLVVAVLVLLIADAAAAVALVSAL